METIIKRQEDFDKWVEASGGIPTPANKIVFDCPENVTIVISRKLYTSWEARYSTWTSGIVEIEE